jgi:CRISPR-associated endonuclease Cas1
MCLRVDHGALVVRNGFTHYPQRVEEYRFFRGDRALPSRIIVLDGSGTLSFEVLSWLSEQNVPLIRINWRGEVVTALGAGHSADPKRVAAQLEAQRNGHALPFAVSLIRQKIRNSIETLTGALPQSPARERAITKLHQEAAELAMRPPKSISALLAIEGRGAFSYFNAWQSLPLRWKGIGRHPIPCDWHRVGQRQSFARKKGRNRNASHPVNAILNYAYAVLEGQVRTEVVAAGFDPTIGLLHAYQPERPTFVLDLMEPLRPIVDRKVIEFVHEHTFHPADFTIRSDGVCRLNPEMARHVVRLNTDRLFHLIAFPANLGRRLSAPS